MLLAATTPPLHAPPPAASAASSAGTFGLIDWLILVAYLAIVILIGYLAGRRKRAGADEFFLAGRGMPMWAVAISVLATSLSAATFIGGPQQAFAGNLTYFSANLGGLLAVVIVAVLFIPAFYRHGVTSIYELLGHEFGSPARTAASGMFMIGRLFASGARLFMVAIPFALIAFGELSTGALIASILLIAIVAALYTMLGGIRAVIWTDVMQAVVLVGSVAVAFWILLRQIPMPAGEIIHALRTDEDGNKLKIVDLTFDLRTPYTLWTALIGFTLFNLAAFGTDQDLTQRMLTCRSAKAGSWSVIVANLIGWPVVLLFLCMGLLLYVYYQRPDVMGAAAPAGTIDDTRKVFLSFILAEIPPGLRGLMIAGLFAAAMSSMDSALNALASTTIADFYRPWRKTGQVRFSGQAESSTLARDPTTPDDPRELKLSRLFVVLWALLLAGFAIVCVFWQKHSAERNDTTLIDFALGVMVFAYSGLLAVFLTALLTRRGNPVSVLAALATGFIAVLLMQPFLWDLWSPWFGLDPESHLAFPWQMLFATTLSFVVCCLGRREERGSVT